MTDGLERKASDISNTTDTTAPDDPDAERPSAPFAATGFELLSVETLMMLPSPSWLVDGVIEERAVAVLYGPSGVGKSFAALDLAMSVATGLPWQGREVRKGPVIFVVGEGTTGAQKRVRAWMQYHDIPTVSDAFFVLRAPQLMEAKDLDALKQAMESKPLKPSLIVLDTLARCFVGGDENSAQDVGRFIAGCSALRDTGASVLVVHHTGKPHEGGGPQLERGSSALRGAADVMIRVHERNHRLVISNEKQKDDERLPDVVAQRLVVDLGRDQNGRKLTSCVLVPAEGGHYQEPSLSEALLTALRALSGLGEASTGSWRAATENPSSPIPAKTFDNQRATLLRMKLIDRVGAGRYTVSDKGRKAIGVPSECHGASPDAPANATPLRGWHGGEGSDVLGEREAATAVEGRAA